MPEFLHATDLASLSSGTKKHFFSPTILTRKPLSKRRVGGHYRSSYSDDRQYTAQARTCDTCSSPPPPSFNNPSLYYSIPTQMESGLETIARVCDLWLIPLLRCDKTKTTTFGKTESLRMSENRVLRQTFGNTTEKYCNVRRFKICISFQINIKATSQRGKGGRACGTQEGEEQCTMGFGGKM